MTTTQTTHTPGPWTVHRERFNRFTITAPYKASDSSTLVASVHVAPNADERDANARLIASAPALLAALKEVKETIALEQFGLLNVVNNAIELAERSPNP